MAKTKKENSKVAENDLSKKLATLREEVRVIRFKAEGSKSKNVKEIATLKKEIARVLTEMNKKK
ncbi:MAG: 50S ribosomal protein L29 [Candidatus Parcubacteria bacterium]|nr:50S ribosomal protein L29 [Candidatus Parcubacteria bacterium]